MPNSGKIVWRAYTTGPDSDVLIGADFKPFYDSDKGKDLGVSTWPADAWRQGGGTVWGWASYDPELNLVYYGTANPGPWNADMRPGDNKYTSGIFARDADTGQARWYYQLNPHDIFDHDGVNENVLVDIQWKGQPRKVLLHPDRNGYLYLMDRTTGEVLSANPFDYINSSTGRRSEDRPLAIRQRERNQGERGGARHLSRAARREGLAALILLAENRAALPPAQPSVHGRRGDRGRLYRRHALCRRQRAHEARPRRLSRRDVGV